MNADRAKFYTELMKSLTAFILGTGAGIYALISSEVSDHYFLIFVSVLCILNICAFIALIAPLITTLTYEPKRYYRNLLDCCRNARIWNPIHDHPS